jgi:hypothetical protein
MQCAYHGWHLARATTLGVRDNLAREKRVRRFWEMWRLLGGAIAAVLLASSQLQPNPLPAWAFPIVAGIALLSLVVALVIDRGQRR